MHHAFLYISLLVFARLGRENAYSNVLHKMWNYVSTSKDEISLSELGYGPSEFNSRRVRLHLTKEVDRNNSLKERKSTF